MEESDRLVRPTRIQTAASCEIDQTVASRTISDNVRERDEYMSKEGMMRSAVFVGAVLWLAPVLTAGAFGLGLSLATAIAVGCACALGIAAWASRILSTTLASALQGDRTLAAVTMVIAAIAIVLIARESVYMADSTQPSYSILPGDPWRVEHSCMSAYFEAARFANAQTENLYDRNLYQPRHIGSLKVDAYHYPPPFLLVPSALRLITTDFFRLRALWFAIQAIVLAATMTGLCAWIGGRMGGIALIGSLFVLSTPTTIFALQMGNFQTTAMALGAIALIFLLSRRLWAGGPILAYVALSKIFPGVLVVYLLGARRWRAVASIMGAVLGLVALSVWFLGTQPMSAFLHHEVPEIVSGQAFPQSERPNVVESNQSFYGLTVRLRLLGASWLDQPTGLAGTSVYGLLIVLLAVYAGWKARIDLSSSAGRALLVQTAIALMTLASFRSPFVGGLYGMVSTLWLLTLLVAGSNDRKSAAGWLLALLVCSVGNGLTPSPTFPPTPFWLTASAAILIMAMGASLWAVVRSTADFPHREADNVTHSTH